MDKNKEGMIDHLYSNEENNFVHVKLLDDDYNVVKGDCYTKYYDDHYDIFHTNDGYIFVYDKDNRKFYVKIEYVS